MLYGSNIMLKAAGFAGLSAVCTIIGLRAEAPVDPQVAHQKRRADLPQKVRHLPLREQLPHAGVDERVARAAPAPQTKEPRGAGVVRPPSMARRVEGALGREEPAAPLEAAEAK